MHSAAKAARTIRPAYFRRPFSAAASVKSTWSPGPSPLRLPKEEQEMYEKLQQQSTGAFSTPRQFEQEFQRTDGDSGATASTSLGPDKMLEQLREKARLAAKGDGEELHPHIRRGAPPEFEGDVNPKTGEVGGPKNEPLRWGVDSDWSYNGRVTDF